MKKLIRIIKIIPILWKLDEDNFTSPINLFRYQLIQLANNFEKQGRLYEYGRIETIIKLMDKVYNYQYATSFKKDITEFYGEFDFNIIKKDNKDFEFKIDWKSDMSDVMKEKLNEVVAQSFSISSQKQQKAHTLLWKMIDRYIQSF